MRKVVQLLASTVVSIGMAGGMALATSTQSCSVSGPTGPNSINTCTNTETNQITISCTNKADVLTVNGQTSNTGTATVNGNTGVGTVSTGNAGNTNFNSTTANMSCGPAAQAAAPSAPAGGQGAGPVAQAAPSAAPSAPVAAKSLPKTGSDSAAVVAGVATASFAGLALAARFGASAYRRLV